MAAPAIEQFSLPLQAEPWTLDTWSELPPTKIKVELVDGMLVVSPLGTFRNRRLALRIIRQLADVVPGGLEVMSDCNAGLSRSRALIPDLAVTDRPGFDGLVLPGQNFVLVGEIASPSTRRYDRTTKRDLYAEAGVRYLLLVDPGTPASAELLELQEGRYVEIARSTEGRLTFDRPFPAELDLVVPEPPRGE